MNFNSLWFFLFALAAIVLHQAVARDRGRQGVLLAASYVFYGSWDPRFVFLLAGVTAAGYLAGAATGAMAPQRRHWGLAGSVALLLAPLLFFKYTNFLAGNLAALLLPAGAPAPHFDIILPVGISFFTFQAISYVCDVAAGRLAAEPSALRFATYMAFFPHLVAGPIVRARDFLPQLKAPWRRPSRSLVAFAVTRFLWGLFKKLCIADQLAASLVDPVFANMEQVSGGAIVLATFAFGLQIYADFSAYGDMALSLARLMGYRLRENFLSPYAAASIREFWRRWHVSLSHFIRDYVYIPMGGSKDLSPGRAALNGMASMLLCGAWHGASWNFVAWGGVHGLAMAAQRLLPSPPRLVGLVGGWAATQAFVMAAWFLFRVPDLGAVATAAQRLAATGIKPYDVSREYLLVLLLDAAILYGEQFLLLAWRAGRIPSTGKLRLARNLPFQFASSGLLLALVFLFMDSRMAATAFIYFRF